AQTGKPQWQQAIAIPTGRSELQRLVDIDAQLLSSLDGVYADSYGGTLALVDPTTGHVHWKRQIKSWTGMALSHSGDLLFISDDDSHVWGLATSSGAKAWEQKALQYRSVTAPAVQDKDVVVGDYEGYLHWLSPDDGRIIGRTRMDDAAIMTTPVVANGEVLYVMDVEGNVAAYKLKQVSEGSSDE
ncbi:MAG: PQQ-binding-like beta-propeller repeat protein, partial [Sinobacteraceae bacterium]|nr:PQQ-binding-like beta-propeller repeat protein [Nevskiaceae bacterium]